MSSKSWRQAAGIWTSEKRRDRTAEMRYSNAESRDVTEVRAPAYVRVGASQKKRLAIPSASSARKRRALVIDTDPVSARLCRETLERIGFVIERVDCGVAAMVAARERVPDLILMDSQLRDVSAAEVIGWLRCANVALASVPIIVIGTIDRSPLAVRDSRVTVALRKPLSPAEIERAVRGLCG
jgi:CheY-like chemotaxis protein